MDLVGSSDWDIFTDGRNLEKQFSKKRVRKLIWHNENLKMNYRVLLWDHYSLVRQFNAN